ncbi:hypothetical protein [Eubacterium pyruvativorans]|uniref:hypothetical protein n=1 Tax=Eubacterium pyruvativorans TaxID=155865 RepID=UPI00088DFDDC|nr:hypothetical protein [Eubacterium pyruvativorans]SDF72226.1 hypothetical protein SAMN04487889_1453 [Eubacterium pyruvativorans]
MNSQLVFCVETNPKNKSDWIYIKETIEHFFKYERGSIKLSPVYMDGKSNYNSGKVQKKIESLKKQFGRDDASQTIVFYCFDCDKYDTLPEDSKFITKAKEYCSRENCSEFVWFCHDIEDVYWKHPVKSHDKGSAARKFKQQNQIKMVNPQFLRAKDFKIHYSNIVEVLMKYLQIDSVSDQRKRQN